MSISNFKKVLKKNIDVKFKRCKSPNEPLLKPKSRFKKPYEWFLNSL